MTSFKVAVITPGDRDYTSNGLRFANREEAEIYGEDLALRWTQVQDWRVEESTDAPTHRLDADGGRVRL